MQQHKLPVKLWWIVRFLDNFSCFPLLFGVCAWHTAYGWLVTSWNTTGIHSCGGDADEHAIPGQCALDYTPDWTRMDASLTPCAPLLSGGWFIWTAPLRETDASVCCWQRRSNWNQLGNLQVYIPIHYVLCVAQFANIQKEKERRWK